MGAAGKTAALFADAYGISFCFWGILKKRFTDNPDEKDAEIPFMTEGCGNTIHDRRRKDAVVYSWMYGRWFFQYDFDVYMYDERQPVTL